MGTVSTKLSNEYALLNFKRDEDDTLRFQPVVFYELHEDGTEENGTTIEEMLRVSLERLTDLNGRFSCKENETAIVGMKQAVEALNARTADRKARGVEGKHEA